MILDILLLTKKRKLLNRYVLLCIILLQMTGYIKHFDNGSKNMSFIIKDDSVLDKYNEIWNKIKMTLNIKFRSMPVYY